MKKLILVLSCLSAWMVTLALSMFFYILFQGGDLADVTTLIYLLILLAFICLSIPVGEKITKKTNISYLFFAVSFIVSSGISVLLGYFYVSTVDTNVLFPNSDISFVGFGLFIIWIYHTGGAILAAATQIIYGVVMAIRKKIRRKRDENSTVGS